MGNILRRYTFDNELLDHIKCGRNSEAKSMLAENLAKKYDSLGPLLHRAAQYGNVEIVKHLIELGGDVDFSGPNGKTPLMVAVENERLAAVKALLDAGAKVEAVDDKRQNVLQMVFHSCYSNTDIIEAFIYKMQSEISDANDLADKLMISGCAPHHAMILRNLRIIQRMLIVYYERQRQTRQMYDSVEHDPAIFVLLELDNDDDDIVAEDPDDMNFVNDQSALRIGFDNSFTKNAGSSRQLVSHLLQNGLVTTTAVGGAGYFGFSALPVQDNFFRSVSCSVNTLIAHLAMIKKLGASILKTAKCYRGTWQNETFTEIESYHELCEQMLDTTMYENATLFDLLTNQHKMRVYVRNERFTSIVEDACSRHQLNDYFPHYFRTLMNCILRAKNMVKLEEAAIKVIYKMFNTNCNQFCIIAREMVAYLNKEQLERLCLAYD